MQGKREFGIAQDLLWKFMEESKVGKDETKNWWRRSV